MPLNGYTEALANGVKQLIEYSRKRISFLSLDLKVERVTVYNCLYEHTTKLQEIIHRCLYRKKLQYIQRIYCNISNGCIDYPTVILFPEVCWL